jgi:hypothetical protein
VQPHSAPGLSRSRPVRAGHGQVDFM